MLKQYRMTIIDLILYPLSTMTFELQLKTDPSNNTKYLTKTDKPETTTKDRRDIIYNLDKFAHITIGYRLNVEVNHHFP